MPLFLKAQPVADFTTNLTNGCPPIVVQFSDKSTGNPTSWSWNLGNGTVSNLKDPSTTYILPGNYTVTLTVSNANGSHTKTVTNYIKVAPAPAVSFIADSSVSCAPKTIQFTNLSAPGGSGTPSYLWDFGDGNTSTAQNPSHTYNTQGNYKVSLIVTNSNGCMQTLTKTNYIKLVQKPAISFSATNTTSCKVPVTVAFTNSTTGGSSYFWDFGDGTTSTQQAPNHTYTSTGNYNVKLVVTNATGCKDSLVKTAFVKAGALKASFVSTASLCVGTTMTFANTTVQPAAGITWLFGNGASSTAHSTQYTYPNAGTYTAKLIANFGVCKDTVAKTITVNPRPSVQFTANKTSFCAVPATVQLTNTTTGAATYAWQSGSNTSTSQNPSFTYSAAGAYDINLIATSANGCKDTLQKDSLIKIQIPTATLTATPVNGCLPATPTFKAVITANEPVTNYSWNFGDGTTSNCSSCATTQHTYNAAGTYNVVLTYTTSGGCTRTVQTTVKYGTKPTAAFTESATNICPATPVNFTNASTGATAYNWNFGDGSNSSTQANPSNKYEITGVYTVRLIADNNGCKDTATKTSLINVKLPRARFTVPFNCANRLAFTFNDQSIGADTYFWEFGDGTTSTTKGNVSHTYQSYGNYTAKLTVTNNATGCTHTFTQAVNTYPITPQFSAQDVNICKGEEVKFTATSSSNYTNYTFNYGNGINSSAKSNTRTYDYPATGQYTVTLIVTDKNGCKDSIKKNNYIKVNGATANFAATQASGCAPLMVNFQDQSSTYGGNVTQRAWVFGNGNTASATTANTTQLYSANGAYTVSLSITDANGCKDSITKTNYISVTKPQAAFTTTDTNICGGQNASFINASTGSTLNSKWNFGDGNTSTQTNGVYAYSKAGTYNVKLVVTDVNGCKDSLTKPSLVKVSVPKPSFTLSDTFASCPPLTVNVSNNSTDAASYSWSFGNGSKSVLAAPTTVYTYPGDYAIKLKGYTANGCVDSITKTVKILGPTGTFSYNATGCSPLAVQFSANTNNTVSYIWDMNDGMTQTTATPSINYTYTQSGKFLPKLILSDGASCLVPVLGLDTVMADKVAGDFSFAANTYCQVGTVQFTDTVYSSIFPVTTRSWNFGDGSTSTAHNPSHTYTAPGTYQAKLLLGTANGCQDTIIKTVTIHPNPVVSAGNNISVCREQATPVTLHATGATSYIWSPSANLSCSTCADPSVANNMPATYTVIGTDTNGCKDTASVSIMHYPAPQVNAGNDVAICEGMATQLQATGAATYSWSPAIGLSCTSCVNPTASPVTTTTYIATGIDANGCTASDTVIVTVNNKPTVNAGADAKICFGSSAQLQATGAATYTWSPTTGLSCTNCSDPVATPSATTTYKVTGTSAQGCSDTDEVMIVINPLPVIAAPSHTICAGDSVQLSAQGAVSYHWSPSASLSCDNCIDPIAYPTNTTTYQVDGTDSNSCTGTTQVTVTVNPLPVVSAGNDQAICRGTSAQLQATGAVTYNWSPAVGLSCTSCAAPVATPAATTTYVVSGANANGCIALDTITVVVNDYPVVDAGPAQTICFGSSAQLLATGAATYTWSPSAGLSCTSCSDPVATPTAATTYKLIGTNAQGCSDTDEVTIIVNPLPVITVPSYTVCAGDSVQLSAKGATDYHWSPQEGLSCDNCQNPMASPQHTTTYDVAGTDSNGCSSNTQFTVTVNSLPVINAGNDQAICAGTAAQLQATGAVTYSWSPAAGLSCTSCANPSATPSATTTYVLTGINANGCTDTDSITITVNNKPVVNAGADNKICAGASVLLQAAGAGNYSWSPATGLSCTSCSDPLATPAATTIYTVVGTDANGCSDTDEVTIVVNPLPVLSSPAQSVCKGDSVQLSVTGATTYSWSPVSTLSCNNCPNPIASPSTTTMYTIVGVDTNGCADTMQTTVTVKQLPIVNAGIDTAICDGSSVTLMATGAASYVWSPAAGLSCTSCAQPAANPSTAASYIVTGDLNGCKATDTVNVKVHPKPYISAGKDVTICAGDTVTLKVTADDNSNWTSIQGLSCTTCKDPVVRPAVTTVYSVTTIDSNGCTASDHVTVHVNQLPVINAGADQAVCENAQINLRVTGADKYEWSPAVGLSCTDCSNPVAAPVTNTVYKVKGTDANGCSDSDEVLLTIVERKPTAASGADTICIGESVKLFASGGDSYNWFPSTGLSNAAGDNPIATPDVTTTYKVLVHQNTCFIDTHELTIVVKEKPVVDAGKDIYASGGNVQLQALGEGIVKYEWVSTAALSCTDCASPVATAKATASYKVTVYNEWGCMAEDYVVISVSCDQSNIFVANTFTPNNDGLNDRFFPQGKGLKNITRFRVFNRWGELMFDRQNMPMNEEMQGWDGTYMGQPLKPDVFVYILNTICESGEPIEMKGDVSLVR